MPESVLTLLKLCLVALLYLFFFRVVRAVWFEMKPPAPPVVAPPVAVARSAAAPPRSAPKTAQPTGGPARHLRVIAPEGLAGVAFDLNDAELTVGRAPGCAVLLGDLTVSTIHARIATRGADRIIEDLDSRNGTFVNKSRITAPTTLHAGDRVGIGPVVVLEVS